jgi:hypothetical protein
MAQLQRADSFETIMSPPHKDGHLFKKQSSWPHNWKKRYASVRNGEFILFKGEQNNTKISLKVPLSNCNAMYSGHECDMKLMYSTDVTVPLSSIPESDQKFILLQAFSHDDREDWIQAFQKAILYAKHFQSSVTPTTVPTIVESSASFFEKAKRRLSLSPFASHHHSDSGGSASLPSSPQNQHLNSPGSKNPFRRLSVYLTGKGRSNSVVGTPASPSQRQTAPLFHSPNQTLTVEQQNHENRKSRRKSVMLFVKEAFNSNENTAPKPLSLVEQYYLEEERKEKERREQMQTKTTTTTSNGGGSRISGISVEVIDQVNSMEALQQLIMAADEEEKRQSIKVLESTESKAAKVLQRLDSVMDFTLSDDALENGHNNGGGTGQVAGVEDDDVVTDLSDDEPCPTSECGATKSSTLDKLKQLASKQSLPIDNEPDEQNV